MTKQEAFKKTHEYFNKIDFTYSIFGIITLPVFVESGMTYINDCVNNNYTKHELKEILKCLDRYHPDTVDIVIIEKFIEFLEEEAIC